MSCDYKAMRFTIFFHNKFWRQILKRSFIPKMLRAKTVNLNKFCPPKGFLWSSTLVLIMYPVKLTKNKNHLVFYRQSILEQFVSKRNVYICTFTHTHTCSCLVIAEIHIIRQSSDRNTFDVTDHDQITVSFWVWPWSNNSFDTLGQLNKHLLSTLCRHCRRVPLWSSEYIRHFNSWNNTADGFLWRKWQMCTRKYRGGWQKSYD